MLQSIIFDVDGVLLDSYQANLAFYRTFLPLFGYAGPTDEEYGPLFPMPIRDVIIRLTKLTDEAEVDRIWTAVRDRIVPYPVELLNLPVAVEDVLSSLSKTYRLGIATSRLKKSIFEAPVIAPLEKYFSAVVSYEDTLTHKPDPVPLLLAAERLGLLPEDCAYVGDAPSDLEAARAAGMKSVLYGPKLFGNPHAFVSDFASLPGALEKL